MIQIMFEGGYEILLDRDWRDTKNHFTFTTRPGPRWISFDDLVIYTDKILWAKEVK